MALYTMNIVATVMNCTKKTAVGFSFKHSEIASKYNKELQRNNK